jgi:hypothetical protein
MSTPTARLNAEQNAALVAGAALSGRLNQQAAVHLPGSPTAPAGLGVKGEAEPGR